MKKYALFILLLLSSIFLSGQPIDSITIKINNQFLKYSATKNLEQLYSIGYSLPWGIQIENEKMSEKDFSSVRKQRTELYFNWILKMIDAGLDVDYDPSAPKNTCFRTSSVFTLTYDPIIEEWKKKNREKLVKANTHHTYTRIMSRFHCYFEFAFIRHEKDINTLEELIKHYVLENKIDENITENLFDIFKEELEKDTCDLF